MTKTPPKLTDRAALLRNRQRADLDRGMFLQNLIADDIQDRLSMVNRDFTNVAVVTGFPEIWRGRFPNATLVEDSDILALTAKSQDLIIHTLALHWANDPVGQLIQCRHALKDDGLLLTASFGGQTLQELRACLAQAESETTGGLSPRILPMGEIRDLGALLQRAGFALPVADSLPLDVSYETSLHLMRDLRAMGETNALAARQKTLSNRAIFARTEELYRQTFAQDDRLKATFEVIFMTGWAPDESQPKPLRPGSASARLADALKTSETKLKP
ncbi:SAM-dependent methyltransferase [Cognatishimia sp.]|uniref:SAM-dependent methyltransferase n=1 Tax=Cognatishimia sp. TaxID=2211648 RepID=UPI0035112EA0|nr:SAM-dependent methyltransferase [Cognatishimia sp.]NQY60728.1 SAM-dependent methyltransferase [Cognatishimia sp.]